MRQEAFAQRLLADPAAVRARVRHTLEQCVEAFFDAAWTSVAVQLATDLRLKNDLFKRLGIAAALASVSSAVTLTPDGNSIIVDELQDNATAAHDTGVTFLPSVFGHPHLVAIHAPGWQPAVQYPVADPSPSEPVPMETVTLRLEAPARPVRLRPRTLARGPHTTSELANAWTLSPPPPGSLLPPRLLRRAGLLTARRHGRYVRYTVNLPDLTALVTDLLAAVCAQQPLNPQSEHRPLIGKCGPLYPCEVRVGITRRQPCLRKSTPPCIERLSIPPVAE